MNAAITSTGEFEDDGERLDADLDEPTTATRHQGIFGEHYSALRQLGWTGVLHLPPGKKTPPLGARSNPLYRSLTGYSGVDCDLSELHTIATTTMWDGSLGAKGNIAVRAQRGVVVGDNTYDQMFLDVDDYTKGEETKTGAATIAKIEANTGVRFPPTCKITSRGDGPSGKYGYLVPAGTKLVPELRPDVETVQWSHRYAVCPPSTNPQSGGTATRAYTNAAPREGDCAGTPIDGMFAPQDCAILPAELVAELAVSGGFRDVTHVTDPEVRAFLDALPGDPDDPTTRCKAVQNRLTKVLAKLKVKGSAYGATRDGVLALLRIGERGHIGVRDALGELENAYVATQKAPGDTELTARAEVARMVQGKNGISMILGDPTPAAEKGCRCNVQFTDAEILTIHDLNDPQMRAELLTHPDIGRERYEAVLTAHGRTPEPSPRPLSLVPPPEQPDPTPGAPAEHDDGNDTATDDEDDTPLAAAKRRLAAAARCAAAARPPRPLWAFSNDDRGNGQRFIETHGTRVAWVPDTKSTRVWLGARWETDTGARMRNLAHLLTDQMLSGAKLRFALFQVKYALVEHLGPKNPDRIEAKEKRDTAEQFLKWSKSSRMDSRLKACVTSAVANPGTSVKSGRWDAHTQLLNLGNGTLELHLDGSHTFREHQQADLLTQQAGVEYDPNAECPTFTRYLNRTLPNTDVRRVVRALAGLSLLGDNNHHIFPVLIGKGRCGKTTLLEVLAGVLDNAAEPAIAYSGSFSLTILRPKQGGGAGPNASLFRIMSRRFVYCSESNDGVALNAELVKRFCGGDRQEARDTYDRARGISDRVPAFTPWLGTNKAPEIEGADDALRERIPVIPFTQYLEPNERDPYLVQKILAEKSGVLNWMLDGHRDVMENPHIIRDLPEECVEAAKEMYRSMNLYQRWLDDETTPAGDSTPPSEDDKRKWITVDESWRSFTAWCHDQREPSGTKHKFGQALAVEGHPSVVVRVGKGKDTPTVRRRSGLTWSPEHLERELAAKILAAVEEAKKASDDSAKEDARRIHEMRAEAALGT